MDAIYVTPRVELRKAKPADAQFIADVVLSGMGYNIFDNNDLDNEITHFGPASRIREALAKVCRKDNTLYSWKNTCIALCGDKLAGALVSYDGGDYAQLGENTFPILENILGCDKITLGEETAAGEYYLDSLAVRPEFRGRSIGKILLRNSLEEAQALGFTKVTLLVDVNKPWLHKLYGSVGFQKGEEVLFCGEPFMKMYQDI